MTVYLVGAGPGDPGLLTVRGAEVLSRAEVVVYDRLSVASLLELAPAAAQRISVGKAPGRVILTQDEINALLVERGRAGLEVVRLKGGDPFVFARGGEEAQALLDAGVPFEVVPGITSAIAVPAYAGIPVTVRERATSFTVVTGHEHPDSDGATDWEAIAKVGGTIVILMGVARIGEIVERLVAGGLDPKTPAAAIQWGTRPEQHTIRAPLAELPHRPLESPSVIVVGEVAGVDVGWFEQRPLFGRQIVVTRARGQASTLVQRLRNLGAEVLEVPVIEIGPPADGGQSLRAAADRLRSRSSGYDWLVLTSVNGVELLFAELHDSRDMAGVKVAVVGPATAAALAAHGVVADLVPERFVAEALLEVFPSPPPGGGTVLLATAGGARDVLADGLAAAGWVVEVGEVYRTGPAKVSPEMAAAAAEADAITFTSSSTVTGFLGAVGLAGLPPTVVCIGTVTAETALNNGVIVDGIAGEHTIDGLISELIAVLSSRGAM